MGDAADDVVRRAKRVGDYDDHPWENAVRDEALALLSPEANVDKGSA